MSAEFLTTKIPCTVEPWIGPEPSEEAFFNAATASVNGHIILLGRIAKQRPKLGEPDLTPFVGIAVENGLGLTERVKELDLRKRLRRLRVVNIEDWRLGPLEEDGSALAGITALKKIRDGYPVFPAVVRVRNLDRPEEVEIDDRIAILEEEGKGTLVTSKTSDSLVEGYYRPNWEKFNHVFAHFFMDQSTGKQSVTYEPVDPPKWGRAKLGFAGLPIELNPEGDEKRRQLFTLHGSRRRSYAGGEYWEYGLGRALRIVDGEDDVKWLVEKGAVILPGNLGQRFFDKQIVYSTGQAVKDGQVIMAVTYGDRGVAKVTFDMDVFCRLDLSDQAA